MTTLSIEGTVTENSFIFQGAWFDDTRTCPTCDGRGEMCLRRSHFLMDIYFVECAQCRGSGIAGSFRRII